MSQIDVIDFTPVLEKKTGCIPCITYMDTNDTPFRVKSKMEEWIRDQGEKITVVNIEKSNYESPDMLMIGGRYRVWYIPNP